MQREPRGPNRKEGEETAKAGDNNDNTDKGLSLLPNIFEIQAIASAAARCGKPRRQVTSRLPSDHPAMIELEMALQTRSMERDQLAICSALGKSRAAERPCGRSLKYGKRIMC